MQPSSLLLVTPGGLLWVSGFMLNVIMLRDIVTDNIRISEGKIEISSKQRPFLAAPMLLFIKNATVSQCFAIKRGMRSNTAASESSYSPQRII